MPAMIVGTGVDIIEIERVAAAYERWGKRFLRKVFTQDEIDYCLKKRYPADSLAARFAAKEAGFKALSQAGIKITLWRSIWVERDEVGRPRLATSAEHALKLHLALSHSKGQSIAVVVAERP
jgi:holo-[acyl-carrier protein] synthase